MKPIEELPLGIRAVFSDLDDTMTTDSKMTAETYEVLWNLKRAGFKLAIISGRPAGWADCLMRLWPLDYMIFENGAGYLKRDGDKLLTISLAKNSVESQRKVLQSHFDFLKKRIPNLKLAADQPYRRFDFAIDYCEEPPRLTNKEVEAVMDYLNEQDGITAKLSSIHVNYWCGKHTKVTACQILVESELRNAISNREILFSGDSPNDEPLFHFFDNSVGVANIKKFENKLKQPPKFVTTKQSGEGFREIAQLLLTRQGH